MSNKKIFILVIVALLLTIIFNIAGQKSETNIAQFADLEVGKTHYAIGLTEGGWPETINDKNERTFWYGWATQEYDNQIVLNWNKNFNSEEVLIVFGDTRGPKEFNITYTTHDAPNNHIPIYETNSYSLDTFQIPLEADNIKSLTINFITTNAGDSLLQIDELYIRGSTSTLTLLSIAIKDYLKLSLYVLLIMLAFIVAGMVCMHYALPKNLKTANRIYITSFFASTFVYLFITVLSISLGREKILYLIPLFLVAVAYIFIKKRLYKYFRQIDSNLLKATLLAAMFLISYQYIRDLQQGFIFQADYLLPYSLSKIILEHFPYLRFFYDTDFLNRDNYEFIRTDSIKNLLWGWHVADRPPLVALIAVPFLVLYRDMLLVFQSLNIVFAIAFIPSLYWLTKAIFSEKGAKYAIYTAPLLPIIVFESINRPNRLLNLCFVLLLVASILDKKWLNSSKYIPHILRGAFAGLAYLAHSSAIFYICGVFLYLLLKRKFRALFITGFTSALFVLPWAIWSRVVDRSTPFFLYPFMVEHWNQVGDLENVMPKFRETPTEEIINIRQSNLLNLFIYDSRSDAARNFLLEEFTNFNYSFYTLLYSVSMPIFLLASFYIFKKLRNKHWKYTLSILIIPIILHTAIVIGWYGPIDVMSSLLPSTLLFFSIGVGTLFTLKRDFSIPMYLYLFIKHLYVIWLSYLGIQMFFSGKGDVRSMISVLIIVFVYFSITKMVYKLTTK